MKFIKLDRRYSGHGFWTHRAEPRAWGPQRALNFFEQREYLNRSFGMGAMVDEVHILKNAGKEIPKWGFDSDGNIFLREEALVQFQLAVDRWS